MRVALALIGAVSLCACPSADLRELPTDSSTNLILVWLEDGVATRAAAIAIDEDDQPFITVPALAPRQRLYALDYPCGLDGLGLSEGPVALALPEEGYVLLSADRVRVLEPESAEFADGGELPVAVRELRYHGEPELTGCEILESTITTVNGTDAYHARVILPLEGDDLLIGTDANIFHRLTTESRLLPMAEFGSLPPLGGARTQTGLFTFAGYEPPVAQHQLGGETRYLTAFPGRTAITHAWIDTAEDGDEVFILTDRRSFAHHRGGAWVHNETFGTSTATLTEGGVARIGAREAFVVGDGENGLSHYRDGVWQTINTPIAAGDDFVSIVHAPGGGVVLGTRRGALHKFDGGSWTTLTTEPVGISAQVLSPIGDGYLFGGSEGVLAQVHPGSRDCPRLQVSGRRFLDMQKADLERMVTGDNDVFAEYRAADFGREVSQIARLSPRGKLRIPKCGAE